MPQDAVTLRRVARALNARLVGGKINKITQPVKDEIDMLVYAGGKTVQIVLSANASCARAGISSLQRENPLVCYAFCMLLRKHLSGGEILSVEQMGSDRVIAFTVKNRNDLREEGIKVLYCEIMGKYSNVILTENGKILGAIKTASLDEASKRVVMPNFPYAPPPAQDKTDFTDLAALTQTLRAFNGGDLGEFLFSRVKGFSYPTAKELAVCTFGADVRPSLSEEETGRLTKGLCEFMQKEETPCVLTVNGKPLDFFPFPYQTLSGEVSVFPDLLSAQDAFYSRKEGKKLLDEGKKRLQSAVKSHENKLKRRLEVILLKEKDCRDMEEIRKKGEILIANLWQIPQGASKVTLPDYYDEAGGTITINLDATLTAQENAAKLFKRYDKEKKTLAAIAPQKEETLQELSYLDSLYGEIDRVETVKDLPVVEAELLALGVIKREGSPQKQKGDKKAVSTPHHYQVHGFDVYVGRNNLQNDALTAEAKGGDLWLHTKDYHSSHVIIESAGRVVPDAVIGIAAELCVYQSSARGAGKTPVDYTLTKYVKKPAGAKPGFVIYTSQQTTFVSANAHEDLRVKG
ncbi:MAG: NFACT family protein [Clostridia bacterium]|nr:NFACT family protein [Clostridia bacterium]